MVARVRCGSDVPDAIFSPRWNDLMRAEIETIVEEIKQAVGLLRRHL
jgi:hypothetical protein